MWHDGAIPPGEIWVKLGGDKWHGSFKFNMQIMNNPHPNSIRNTTLIAVHKGNDNLSNLHIALDNYKVQIEEMQGMVWRYNEHINYDVHNY